MAPRHTLMLVSAAVAALTFSNVPFGPTGSAEAAQAKQQRTRPARPATRRNWAQFLQAYIDGEFRANPAFAVSHLAAQARTRSWQR